MTAIERAAPGFAGPALDYLHAPEGPALSTVLTVLINSLVAAGAELLLLLDDYHDVTVPAVHGGLGYLVEHLPPNLHLVLSMRFEPPLLLARWRARGWLAEMGTDDLRSTLDEPAACSSTRPGSKSEADTRALLQRTEGWPAGVQLLGLSLRGQTNASTVLEEVSGSQAYILDYLTEEVLRRDLLRYSASCCRPRSSMS